MIHWAMGNAGMHGVGCPLGQVQRARGGAMMGHRHDVRGVLSPQQGFVHTWQFRKVCGPKRAGARVQTPEMHIDWYSPITKLRRQRSAFKDL
jgi:hypothetical protein